jgi:AAA15 family ATPase/GTPase
MKGDLHYTEFSAQNFKLFQEISVRNLGQINLIVGDNNVGKTSLLEALLVEESSDQTVLLKRLHKTLCFRNIHIHLRRDSGGGYSVPSTNYFDFLLHDLKTPLKIKIVPASKTQKEISLTTTTLLKLASDQKSAGRARQFQAFPPNTVIVEYSCTSTNGITVGLMPLYADDLTVLHNYQIPFIPASSMYDSTALINGYQVALASSKTIRQQFIQNLKSILPTATGILPRKIHEVEHLAVELEGSDESFPLAQFGDGTVKCARIFMDIARYQNGRLMIDEIDAGIHHTRLDNFWKVIVKAAFDNEVQLFAVTHNAECLKSLKRVFESNELKGRQKEVRCIALSHLADGKTVKAYTYPWEEFQAAIDHDNELR